ncbi:MAG TPA: S41 family peptidase [Candidatus Nitrosotalea sp.]|nr:S41 family peptidase [Candidatus Nitrosotalea sp.]
MKRLSSLVLAAALGAALVQIPASAAQAQLSTVDAGEVATSYGYLTDNFYKKVDPQIVLDSVRTQLLAAVRAAGVKHAELPVMHAGAVASGNVREIDHEIEAAAAEQKKISLHDLTYVALDGMMRSVNDRYTVFMTPKEFAGLNQGLDGSDFGGTGIVIQIDDKTKFISVENVVPDGPADKAGIQQDDLITSIDGASTKGLSLNQASGKLRGKEGTKVTLTVVRDNAALPSAVTITRAKIHQLSVYEKMLPGKIGYIALTVFGRETGDELNAALGRLQKQGARALVLDLRDNGGGYLEAAVAVSSKFIPSGPIVSVESRASNITTLDADDTAIDPLPLVVLVNGYTASASEITSGAIQDSSVGTIIGTKTFGKGVVQTIIPLPDRSAIKVTTARYLTPRNRDINHLGITPDVVVIENKHPQFGQPAKDDQLTRAIQYLDDKLAHLSQENSASE